MKRVRLAKRRDRRSSKSPYSRYGKSEFRYSADYYAWRRQFVKEAAAAEVGPR